MNVKVCGICGGPADEWICDECYKCPNCGESDRRLLRFTGSKIICDTCHQQEVMKQISLFDGDTSFTQEITCPYCGLSFTDSWEMSDSGDEECSYCGNTYSYQRDIEVTYSTEKKGEPRFDVADWGIKQK